jgi:NSS family neurotransmitter:Na+ symporter
MAIFGSYLGRERSLPGESVNILVLDTFVAVTAGLIIFPACFTFDVEPGAGPELLFVAMAKVFNNMAGGRWWGSLFFLFMVFAAFSTITAVFENILACVKELTNWGRVKTCIICGVALLVLSVPCALGFNLWSGFVPFASGSSVLDLEDFIVSNCCLPLGALCYLLFCVSKKGWGFDNFMSEANSGKGLKLGRWVRPYMTYILPAIIIIVFVVGILTFSFADDFTLLGAIKKLIDK